MNENSIARIGLVLVLATSNLAACSGTPKPDSDQDSTGGTANGATGATGATGSGGTSGTGAGGVSGANPVGGGAGTSGTNTGGGAGTDPGVGGGAGLSGGSAGTPATGGVSGDAGAGTGGAGTGGVGMGGDGAGGSSTGAVTVQLGMTKQKIDGFGINNTWAQAMTDADADAMFSTTNGLGLSILRVGLGPDGQPMSGNIPADMTKARARNVTYIIGSCWSPPATCKSNNNINDGGTVNTNCYESWSTTIASFADTNNLYAMSIGNEPDFASCGRTEPCNGNYPTTVYTANQMVAFLKIAAPKLRAAGVKVIAPEASEWIHQWSNASATGSDPGNKNSSDPLRCGFPPTNTACNNGGGYDYGHALYRDSTAWGLLDIMGVHQYDTQKGEPWPADVPEKKPVWQTEMSGVKWWPEQGPSRTIENGVAVAGWIHSALTVGEASAWLWWWWKAYDTDDNEGLYLKNGMDTKRHYTFMNYSRFIRPNYNRVDITGAVPANILLTAFKGTGSTVVIVAINKGTAAATVPITIAGGTAPAMLTPWVTSANDDFVSKTAVAVSGGTFMASLAGMTVTTFVGQ